MNQFLQRYENLGESFDPKSIELKPSLRVNTLRINEDELISRLKARGVFLEKIDFIKSAYYYDSAFSLASTIEYLMGYFYIQEVASMIPAELLAKNLDLSSLQNADSRSADDGSPPADQPYAVLDLAAAPGSKTTQLAALFEDKVSIVALDSNVSRLKVLEENVNRLGIKSVIMYKKDGKYVDDLGVMFDAILVDAPCSGNFCVEPDFFESKLLFGIKDRSNLQKDLLAAAAGVLKPGGILVYSTCSLEPEENEEVVDWFIKEFDDFFLQPIDLPIGDPGYTKVFDKELDPSISNSRRFWPHKTGTEGFFCAVLKKRL